MAQGHGGDFLVPKLGLGMSLLARLSLATIFVPKYNLGTSGEWDLGTSGIN